MRTNKSFKTKKITHRLVFWVITICILIFFLYPPFWLITTSIKLPVDAFSVPPKFIFTPTLQNYARVFINTNFMQFMVNSIITSFFSTFLCMLIGIPAGYALAVYFFRGRSSLRFLILSTRVSPPIMGLLPLYLVFLRWEVLGTKLPLIIMYVVMNLPLVLWVLPVYFSEVPTTLKDAAVIDGCTEWQAFYKIMLPLAKTGLMATSILCLIAAWNDFLYALILGGKGAQTLPVAITSYLTYRGTEWGQLSAAGSVVMLPMLLFSFFIQGNFVKGMTMGAVKG